MVAYLSEQAGVHRVLQDGAALLRGDEIPIGKVRLVDLPGGEAPGGALGQFEDLDEFDLAHEQAGLAAGALTGHLLRPGVDHALESAPALAQGIDAVLDDGDAAGAHDAAVGCDVRLNPGGELGMRFPTIQSARVDSGLCRDLRVAQRVLGNIYRCLLAALGPTKGCDFTDIFRHFRCRLPAPEHPHGRSGGAAGSLLGFPGRCPTEDDQLVREVALAGPGAPGAGEVFGVGGGSEQALEDGAPDDLPMVGGEQGQPRCHRLHRPAAPCPHLADGDAEGLGGRHEPGAAVGVVVALGGAQASISELEHGHTGLRVDERSGRRAHREWPATIA